MNRLSRFCTTGILYVLSTLLLTACGGGGGGGNPTPTPSPPGDPQITDVSPAAAPVNATVTITGANFGDAQATSTVTLGTTNLIVSSWSNTKVQVTVPDLYPASLDLVAHVDGKDTNALTFGVILPPAVYVNNDQATTNTISGWRVDRATGALTLMANSPFATGDGGADFGGDGRLLVLHEATRRLFATGSNDDLPAKGSVSVFDIDPVTGELSLVSGSPFPTGAFRTFGIDITSDGSRILAANFAPGTVDNPSAPGTYLSVMDVNANGTLTLVASSPHPTAVTSNPYFPMISNDDTFVYVNTQDSEFLGFKLNADGSLTGISGNPYFTGANTRTVGGRLHPAGTGLYLAELPINSGNVGLGVLVFRIDRSTGVASSSPNSPVAAEHTDGMAFNSSGTRLYVAQFDSNGDGGTNGLYLFDVDANSDLSMAGGSPFSLNVAGMSSIELSTDDRFLFVADEGGAAVGVYAMDAAGTPTEVPGSPFENLAGPYDGVNGYGASGLVVTPW